MLDVLLDTVLDSVRLLPFLFLTYLFMEALEHHTGSRLSRKIQSAGKWGPVWGGLLGVIPHEPLVYEYDCAGKPTVQIPLDSPARKKLESLLVELGL